MSAPGTGPTTRVSTTGPVLVIGSGLLGTSLALALTTSGVEVQLSDTSPTSLALARDMGAGSLRTSRSAEPTLVVVATPPDVVAPVVLEALRRFPEAVVTDVASVKDRIGAQVTAQAGEHLARYVGSHPMAGRERSGAGGADADLFVGRPWVIVGPASSPEAELVVRNLAVDLGATPVRMAAAEHDAAVAAVSHVPQLVSSLLAARLEHLPESALALAGQGLRDTTRIAASDPRLWASILVANAGPVTAVLHELSEDLHALLDALGPEGDTAAKTTESTQSTQTTEDAPAAGITPGAVGAVTEVMTRGNTGRSRLPGKHGGAPHRYAQVQVLVPDAAGELGRLFSDVGRAGVSIEDFALEHSAGQKVGLAQLSVLPATAAALEENLEARGWRVVPA